MEQLERWLDEAKGLVNHNAAALATASRDGIPSVRTVLLKEGLVFYTNYNSRKATEIDANRHVSLSLYWRELGRQVVINGTAERLDREEVEAYFAGRPRMSQLTAWAMEVSGRETESVEELYTEQERRWEGKDVPCPPYWGGYRVVPTQIEYWIEGEGRLHDRFQYKLGDDGWHSHRITS